MKMWAGVNRVLERLLARVIEIDGIKFEFHPRIDLRIFYGIYDKSIRQDHTVEISFEESAEKRYMDSFLYRELYNISSLGENLVLPFSPHQFDNYMEVMSSLTHDGKKIADYILITNYLMPKDNKLYDYPLPAPESQILPHLEKLISGYESHLPDDCLIKILERDITKYTGHRVYSEPLILKLFIENVFFTYYNYHIRYRFFLQHIEELKKLGYDVGALERKHHEYAY